MIRRLTLVVGIGAGYVLGAKAGKERYTQIEGKVRALLDQPAVQQFTGNVSATASTVVEKATSAVRDMDDPTSVTEVEATSRNAAAPSVSTPAGAATSTLPLSIDDMTEFELEQATAPTPPRTP